MKKIVRRLILLLVAVGVGMYINASYLRNNSKEEIITVSKLEKIIDLSELNTFEAVYSDEPQKEFIGSWNDYVLSKTELLKYKEAKNAKKGSLGSKQQQLFDNSLD